MVWEENVNATNSDLKMEVGNGEKGKRKKKYRISQT